MIFEIKWVQRTLFANAQKKNKHHCYKNILHFLRLLSEVCLALILQLWYCSKMIFDVVFFNLSLFISLRFTWLSYNYQILFIGRTVWLFPWGNLWILESQIQMDIHLIITVCLMLITSLIVFCINVGRLGTIFFYVGVHFYHQQIFYLLKTIIRYKSRGYPAF